MDDKTIISIVGITAIVFLEGCALLYGIDGIMLTATVGTIATIIGYTFGRTNAVKDESTQTTK